MRLIRVLKGHGGGVRVVLICLIVVLVLQFLLYWTFVKKASSAGKVRELEQLRPFSAEEVVKEFLQLAVRFQVPVIPYDSVVLRRFLSNATASSILSYICQKEPIIFAAFNEILSAKGDFMLSLAAAKFVIVPIVQQSESKVDLIVVHYLLTKSSSWIHLLVFHHHDGNFWWHGKLHPSQVPSNLQKQMVSVGANFPRFVQTEGALDKFKVRSVMVSDLEFYLPDSIPRFLEDMEGSRFIMCNHTRATLFRERYGKEVTSDSVAFRTVAQKILAIAKQSLGALGVRFWLSSGTCLGYFRQCDVFPHGQDVDIGIWIKEYRLEIISSLLAAGMSLKHKLGKVEDSLELSFLYAGLKLDIFFFYKEDGYVWNGGLQTKSGRKFKYVFPKFSLCWTVFLSLKLRVPCETQLYVEANYGPDWFVPVTHWDWKTSPFNVQDNGRWPEEEWPEVIQQMDEPIAPPI